MYLKETIRGILAFVMLLLFSFSITPKKYLHALLANHTDNRFQAFTDEASVSQKGFNCDTDDIVVKAPFVGGMKNFVFSLSLIFPRYLACDFISHFYNNLKAKDSRGPPALL